MTERVAIARPWSDGGSFVVQAVAWPGDVLYTLTEQGERYVTLTAWNLDETAEHKVYVVLDGIETPVRLPALTGRWLILDNDVLGRRAGDDNPSLTVYADLPGVVAAQWELYK